MRSVIVAADLMLTWPPSVFPVSPGLGEEHVRGEVVSSDPLRGDVDLHQLLIVFILQVLIGYIPELITILE